MEKRCLVVVAHGDDETNGMGGTLIRLRNAGWAISIVYLTLPNGNEDHPRAQECIRSAEFIGARHFLANFEDGRLFDDIESRAFMALVYDNVQPTLVLALHGLDVHPDHRAASALALGPAMQRGVNIEYFTCELCSSGRHTDADRPQTLGFFPTHYVDVSDIQLEVEEFQHCHTSQDPEAMVAGMARVHKNRAAESGVGQYAEGWVRLTRVGSLAPELQEIFLTSPLKLPRAIGIDFDPVTIGIET